MNEDLRKKIVEIVHRSKEGHIPSSFSIVDIINHLYENELRYNSQNPDWGERDYFILSKGHGCAGLYVVLEKFGFISSEDLQNYSSFQGILGGHPDMTKVPGVEASTGSLGHGFPTAIGLALGLRIQNKNNRIFCLIGDGECHEGTIWESANVGANQKLGNLCAIIDWNKSGAQLMPVDDVPSRWRAFGWETYVIDGHSHEELTKTFSSLNLSVDGKPKAVICNTIKGKGVSFLEGHGIWHHRIPSRQELLEINRELS
jgi:transketolase